MADAADAAAPLCYGIFSLRADIFYSRRLIDGCAP